MASFFQDSYTGLVDSPNNSTLWFHSFPLPDGTRTNGAHPDKLVQFKLWEALGIGQDGLAGKQILDIGANDGFSSVAAMIAGAKSVVAIDKGWISWPANIEYGSSVWNVSPEIVTADFRTHDFSRKFDVIFFLGVLYHLENVFEAMEVLSGLLEEDGVVYLESQMSQIESELPVFESASDIFPTIGRQYKDMLGDIGQSNYLFPNVQAIRNLAYAFDFECELLDGKSNVYSVENPTGMVFRLRHVSSLQPARRGPTSKGILHGMSILLGRHSHQL